VSQSLSIASPSARQAGAVVRVVGLILAIFSATMLLPLLVAIFRGEPSTPAFIEAAAFTAATGLAIWYATRRQNRELQSRDGFLLVSLT